MDIIVHPDFARNSHLVAGAYAAYWPRIMETAKTSDAAIVVQVPGRYLPIELRHLRSVESIVHTDSRGLIHYWGEVRPKEWDRFLGLIDGHDDFRVHGTYAGHCVTGFATQLYGWVAQGQHWADLSDRTEGKPMQELQLIERLDRDEAFVQAPIRYGTLLAKPGALLDIRPQRSVLDEEAYVSTIDAQLTDAATRIFRPEDFPEAPARRSVWTLAGVE
ncbi:hypothetical protein COY28_03320 [Candidatus Woesearchaeota archaeon CG_4_10_14_0_2_um_filter_57_5]|nr:MAG: hypothetical protein AUJ68_02700 [Candidatus Woesearchaeota archaeon CG1_02_57_44]PIN68900.1 MAG: hypothetical protein COV94_03630 [Candidatus Woesearchaeota archaeon CG11_big_fil_rev_8_21_14_0_20_57_5]PIZ53738.1 MAG: hypothetical protein COY28_03320 [Candidatus Woesearchaeota archaeon CG_4_10_14_0_2_um_filter_57_5]